MESKKPDFPDDPNKQQQYAIKGVLDLSEVKELDRSIPLQISAVRNNRVIQSETITLAGRDDTKIDFDLEFQLPGRRCGVYLMITRGDIKDSSLLASNELKRRISASEWEKKKASKSAVAYMDVGQVTVHDHIYKRWLFICRRFTVRGRVVCRDWVYDNIEQQWVFVDAPVPGATVEAYDVDRWFWWCFKDLIKTAVTDVNGYFEMDFIWCCRRWFPFHAPWIIDPELLKRIRRYFEEANFPVPIPDPPGDPLQFQDFLQRTIQSRGADSLSDANLATQLTSVETAAVPRATAQNLKALFPAAPELEALRVWPWYFRRDCTPDVIFRVTQPCENEVRVIYEETCSQTRWNIPTNLNVTLEANDEACCAPIQPDPPCGDCLGITQVGCTDVANIGISAGPPDLRGYAYPNNLDRPFGGRLTIHGEFGEDSHPILDYYRVEYHKDGMAPGTWIDMGTIPGLLHGISRRYLDPDSFPPPFYSSNINFGPQDFVGDGKLYYKTKYKYQRDNAPAPDAGWIWTRPDWLFRVNTDKLPQGDGLYTFRVVGYRQAGDGTLVDERVMPLCGTEDDDNPIPATLMVRTDNRIIGDHPPSIPSHPWGSGTVHLGTLEPDCDFVSIVKNEGTPESELILPCDDVVIANTDTVTIHFNVTTPMTTEDAHLLAYRMSVHWGESNRTWLINPSHVPVVLAGDPTPQFGPTYFQALTQGAVRPFWSGGSFKVTIPGSAFPVSCAYLLRLRAWKRTTHGCTSPFHFHWNTCEFSFCVAKP